MAEETQAPSDPQFRVQKVYVKDVSFETPNSPQIFMTEWEPEVDFNLGSNAQQIQENTFEVTLKVTVTVKLVKKRPISLRFLKPESLAPSVLGKMS